MKFYESVSLGILAGGRGSRLNGADKAFVRHEDRYLCERILDQLDVVFADRFISARSLDERFGTMGLIPVLDKRTEFSGPLAGIEALLDACNSEYLLSIPADIKNVPTGIIHNWLNHPLQPGALLRDSNGMQPLLALWHVESCLPAVKQALDQQQKAVHTLLSALNFIIVDQPEIQIGNLNTPEDFNTL